MFNTVIAIFPFLAPASRRLNPRTATLLRGPPGQLRRDLNCRIGAILADESFNAGSRTLQVAIAARIVAWIHVSVAALLTLAVIVQVLQSLRLLQLAALLDVDVAAALAEEAAEMLALSVRLHRREICRGLISHRW